MKTHPKKGFTLIELLTVIAIIGILASILIPTVSKVRETARRMVDASNLRQVGQAQLIYANDNNDQLPGRQPVRWAGGGDNTEDIDSVHLFAATLALTSGLNDASIWVSASDASANVPNNPGAVLNSTRDALEDDFEGADVSFVVPGGLNMGDRSTSPIGWTRGADTSGEWVQNSVYGGDGGHITFLGGNTEWYRNLQGDNRLQATGERGDQGLTENIAFALPDREQSLRVWGQGDGHQNLGLGTGSL